MPLKLLDKLVGPDWKNPRHPDFWFLALLAAGVVLRLLYLTRPFDWFVSFFIADDCFYYLNTVVNIVQGHGTSFDGGLTHHNGFHPLFLVLLLFPALLGVGKIGLLYWAMALLNLSIFAASILAYRLGALLGSRVMALCVPVTLLLNIFFVKISFSGFETALASALVIAVFYALASGSRGWVVGILLGLTGLARVELLALALPVALVLIQRGRWKDLWMAGGISLALMLPWFIWSWVGFHSLLPLSGVAKISGFRLDRLWVGFENFCTQAPYLLAGYEWKDKAPHQLAFAIGVVLLFLVARDWRRTGWGLLFIVMMMVLYGSLTNPERVPQFTRYCVPCFILLGIIFFSRQVRPRAFIPLLLTVAVLLGSSSFYSWSARTGRLATFVGLGQSEVPRILEQITVPGDVVGCFDSGSIGYFAGVPVINLDGLVNGEVVRMLRSEEGGSWTGRYRRYFAEKGITVMVGGSRFSWVRIFPDLAEWEVLHEPLKSMDGGEIVFLRVPPPEQP